MHPALRKGPLFCKKHPPFSTFFYKTPPFHFLPTGLSSPSLLRSTANRLMHRPILNTGRLHSLGKSRPDLLQAGPLFRKNVGPLIYEYPTGNYPPDCLHPTLYSLIILIFLACYHAAKNEKMSFRGPPIVGFLFGRTC